MYLPVKKVMFSPVSNFLQNYTKDILGCGQIYGSSMYLFNVFKERNEYLWYFLQGIKRPARILDAGVTKIKIF